MSATLISHKKYRSQHLLTAIAIFMGFVGVAFSVVDGVIVWLWQDIPFIGMICMAISTLIWAFRTKASGPRRNQESESATDKLHLLTPRQSEVLDLIKEGYSNKEIASQLFIEQSTLKTHINKIYQSLDIKSRKEVQRLK